MADFTALKTAIQNAIKQNGNEEITGNLLQEVLLAIVTTLGDGSINDLITALGSEATTRGNADTTLQQNIDAEAQARSQADGTLQQNIDAEATTRNQADTALGGRIDGVVSSIEAINNAIGNGYVYAGIATPSSTPTTGKVFYLALTAGTYTNFGNIAVSQGINILKYNGSAWSLDAFVGIDDTPTPSSNNLVKSGGAFDFVMKNGSAFDLSAYNNGTTYTDLDAALIALNALPAAYKKGGMSLKFIQTSDGNYVQFRCIADEFTTDTTLWVICGDSVLVVSPEWMRVITDKRGRILAGIKTDGSIEWSIGVPKPIRDAMVAKIEGKDLIDKNFADGISSIENPEWISVTTDVNGKILFGIKKNGNAIFGEIPPQIIRKIEESITNRIIQYLGLGDEHLAFDTLNEISYFYGNIASLFYGHKISILGDSISTFDQAGYKMDGAAMYYPAGDVTTVNDTWWKQLIDNTDGIFEFNASWAGSKASQNSNPSMDFWNRVSVLGNPDIIIVALGSNDSGQGIEIGTINYHDATPDLSKFAPAYIYGMQKIKEYYPTQQIVCMSFGMTDDYADTIKEIATHYNAKYIDARKASGPLHPNKTQMENIRKIILKSAKSMVSELQSLNDKINNL